VAKRNHSIVITLPWAKVCEKTVRTLAASGRVRQFHLAFAHKIKGKDDRMKLHIWDHMMLAATAFATANFTEAQSLSVHYQLEMSQPHTHLFEVEINLDGLAKNENAIDFILPVWRSGRYVIFDFAGGVQEFSAQSGGTDLSWKKIDKSTWRVETKGNGKITARYKVFADEFESRTRGLDDRHGFVDPSAVFMYVEKFRSLPLTLQVHPFGDWHITTGLDAVSGKKNLFKAPNYDYFIDCPLEIGAQKDFDFEAEGKPHRLMIFGEGNWDEKKMIEDLKKIIKTVREFWGDLPYEHYTFMLHCTPSGGGGTEHINSTIIGLRPFVFRDEDSYRGFLSVSMHEFFHTWNVKQLRPAGINPYDFTRENYVEELWLSEGTTDYYTGVLLRRAGFVSVDRVLDRLEETIRSDKSRPGSKIQSLAQSSFDAWVKFWKNSPNAFNSEVDYYDKGADVSLLLDLEIRQRSQNRVSLDDVMRTLYKRFPLSGPGFTNTDVRKIAEELTGSNYSQFFDDFVYGTAEIDFKKFLTYAGLEVTEKEDKKNKPSLGITTAAVGDRTVIRRVAAGSSAYAAGIDRNDELLALNGVRVRHSDLESRLSDFKAGDKVSLTIFRDDQLRQVDVTLQPSLPEYQVTRVKVPTELQKKIYGSWLGTEWPEEKASE
jgi:predicted metalloprotease with PDZ domain